MKCRLLLHRTAAWAIFGLLIVQGHAGNVCVGPTATGDGGGGDWNNLKAWSSNVARGDTWYLAVGTYSGKNLNTAASGTTLISIKKATASDHGTDTGWSDAFGSGQAVFSGQINFATSYWIFDGQTGGGPGSWTSGFGFKVVERDDSTAVIATSFATSGQNVRYITIKHVELVGKGSVTNSGGSMSNDGFAFFGGGDILVSYAYVHDIGRCPWFGGSDNTINEYVYTGSFFGSTSVHSELASIWNFAGTAIKNWVFRYCVITHIASTGGIMFDNSSSPSGGGMQIYGCVFYRPSGDTWEKANGVIGGWSGGGGEEFHDVKVYHNTFIDIDQATLSTMPNVTSGCEAKNNLFYNCASPDFTKFPEHDYNHFINSGGSHGEANGTGATTGSPFQDYGNLNCELTANTSPGVDLGSSYNVDATGQMRATWTRGAYEFGAVKGTVPAPPQQLRILSTP